MYLVRWDAQYDEYLYYYIRFNLAPAPTPSAPLWQEGLVYVWSMLSQDAAAKLFFCFWFWGKVFLENFISLVGPGDQQLICFYAPVQFSHKVNQKSHVALKNDSRPFVKNDLCPKRIPGYYDQIDCVLKTIGSNGDTSTWGLENIHSFGPLSHCP